NTRRPFFGAFGGVPRRSWAATTGGGGACSRPRPCLRPEERLPPPRPDSPEPFCSTARPCSVLFCSDLFCSGLPCSDLSRSAPLPEAAFLPPSRRGSAATASTDPPSSAGCAADPRPDPSAPGLAAVGCEVTSPAGVACAAGAAAGCSSP